jgi:hypothetical protein
MAPTAVASLEADATIPNRDRACCDWVLLMAAEGDCPSWLVFRVHAAAENTSVAITIAVLIPQYVSATD